MWSYLIGPILALLPKAWRESLPFAHKLPWGRATVVSGVVEMTAAIVAMGYWYMYEMTRWVDRGVSAALDGKVAVEVTVQQIGGVALALWATHPVTWLLGYFMFEGAIRLGAAAGSGENLGILPLAVVDWILFKPFRRGKSASAASNAGSLVEAVRERVVIARGDERQDELRFWNEGAEELMEIHAWRRKEEWIPPRVVRYEDTYYRLEASDRKSGPRPFYYMLRRQSAGVPGRNVLLYSPGDALVVK